MNAPPPAGGHRSGKGLGVPWRAFLFAGLGALAAFGPAAAQITGSLAVQSNYVFRGDSISAGKPAAVLNLSYDNPSGLYLNGSTIADLDRDDTPAFMGYIVNAGYGRRLNDALSVDAGVIHSQYDEIYGHKSNYGYTEEYAGMTTRNISARIYYSSDYFKAESHTVYAEIEGGHEVWAGINLGAHIGYLDDVAHPAGYPKRDNAYDWRLSASHPLRPATLFVAVSGGGPGNDFYLGEAHSKTVVMGGITWAF